MTYKVHVSDHARRIRKNSNLNLIFPHDSGHGVKLPVQITSVSDVR